MFGKNKQRFPQGIYNTYDVLIRRVNKTDIRTINPQHLVKFNRLFEADTTAEFDKVKDMGFGVGLEENVVQEGRD